MNTLHTTPIIEPSTKGNLRLKRTCQRYRYIKLSCLLEWYTVNQHHQHQWNFKGNLTENREILRKSWNSGRIELNLIAQTSHFGAILEIFQGRESEKNLPIMDPTDADSLLESLAQHFERMLFWSLLMIKTALDIIRAGKTTNAQAQKIDREVKT